MAKATAVTAMTDDGGGDGDAARTVAVTATATAEALERERSARRDAEARARRYASAAQRACEARDCASADALAAIRARRRAEMEREACSRVPLTCLHLVRVTPLAVRVAVAQTCSRGHRSSIGILYLWFIR